MPRLSLVLLALVVAGSANTTYAASVDVHVYGTLLPFGENARATGATAPGPSPANGDAALVPASAYTGVDLPARFRISSGTSSLGFKGSLEVNDSLKVIWQIESAVSPDGDPPNVLAGRNSGVGLAGGWGTLIYGSWDTPYKYPLLFVTPMRGVNPFDNVMTANPGFNVPGTTTQSGRASGKADAAFSRRQGNSVQYWSPRLFGFSARLAYSTNEGRTAASDKAPSTSPDIYSALLTYEHGPVGVRYGFERHHDYFGLAQLGGSQGATFANRSSRDFGHEVVGWLSLPTGTKLSAVLERLIYDADDTAAGAVARYERDAYYFLVQQTYRQHQVWGAFGHAAQGNAKLVGGAAASTKGLAAKQWSVGYAFSLAKSADVYASYYQIDDDRSASYAAFPSVGPVAPGSTTRGFGVGILYTFDASWKTAI